MLVATLIYCVQLVSQMLLHIHNKFYIDNLRDPSATVVELRCASRNTLIGFYWMLHLPELLFRIYSFPCDLIFLDVYMTSCFPYAFLMNSKKLLFNFEAWSRY